MTRHAPMPRGFTLIEVLVSLLLLSIVLPAVMGGISLSLRTAEEAKFKAQASSLARAKLTELQAANQWELQKLSGDFGVDSPYRWNAELTNFEGTTLLQLDVTVLWRQREQERAVTVSTLVTNTGVAP